MRGATPLLFLTPILIYCLSSPLISYKSLYVKSQVLKKPDFFLFTLDLKVGIGYIYLYKTI